MLAELQELRAHRFVSRWFEVGIYLGLGLDDELRACCTKLVEERSPRMAFLFRDPMFDDVRNRPCFRSSLVVSPDSPDGRSRPLEPLYSTRDVPFSVNGLDSTLNDHPLSTLGALFAAGLATSLTPCVYPMIPITSGILGGSGAVGRSRGRTLLMTLLYVSGLAIVYATLGLLAGSRAPSSGR